MKQENSSSVPDVKCDDITSSNWRASLLLASVPARLIVAVSFIALLWVMLSFLIK